MKRIEKVKKAFNVINALKTIQDYCRESNCDSCLFGGKYEFCDMKWNGAPEDWNTEKLDAILEEYMK